MCAGPGRPTDPVSAMGARSNLRLTKMTPPPWGVKNVEYETMIQPIFDKNCGSCHQGSGKARTKLDLTFRKSPYIYPKDFSEPYVTLVGSALYLCGSLLHISSDNKGGTVKFQREHDLRERTNYLGAYDVEGYWDCKSEDRSAACLVAPCRNSGPKYRRG